MPAIDLIPSLARERVVVAGSLPPHGRDLDLLVRPEAADEIAAGLAAAGFLNRGRIWARFADCGADVVELVPAASLGLPPDELDAVFAQALPIEPTETVCRPAAHHSVLMLSRRVMREGPRPLPKRLRRADAEVASDPEAFAKAVEHAPAWGAERALAALQRVRASGGRISAGARKRAIFAELRRSRGAVGARVGAWRAVLRRPRRGSVVALSGLDGSGKSSQAEHLAETLERLGYETEIVWTSVAFHPPLLGRIARALKRPLRTVAARLGGAGEAEHAPGAPRGSDDPAKALRRRSGILTFLWSTVITAVLSFQVARRTWPPLLGGRVVVCDRFLLDAWAHLLYQYGEERRYSLQLAILRRVFPEPRAAYLLDVAPETAAARKQEFDADQNARRAEIYRRLAGELGVKTVDAERPRAEVCEVIARGAWESLD